MNLQFNVENKLLKRTDINKIMPRAIDVVANFTFDEIWSTYDTKKIIVQDRDDTYIKIIDSTNTCDIDSKFIDLFGFTIQVIGYINDVEVNRTYPLYMVVSYPAKSITSGIKQANAKDLGGIRAETKTTIDNTEVKIDASTGKLFVHTAGAYTLPQASETKLGGIKASEKDNTYTEEVKIDTASGKLFTKAIGNNKTFEELVKVTPTDINVDANGNLILEHDGVEISNQKKLAKFKTLFGNMTLYGDGNIDLYRHFITLNDTIYLEYLSSNNLTADSLQDLTTLTKAKNGTKIKISETNYIEYTTVWKFKDGTLLTKVTDDVTTV